MGMELGLPHEGRAQIECVWGKMLRRIFILKREAVTE
jgi:hypothetical protein